MWIMRGLSFREDCFAKYILLLAPLVCLFFFQGCASDPVEKAFAGKYDRFEETKIIVEYCQGCHIHRNFDFAGHLGQAPAMYENEPFSSADDCRTCHAVRRNFWHDEIRSTYFPEGRIVKR